ncbi:class I SAM-dependent methyltransferase [candidate division KSB1 bacterium]
MFTDLFFKIFESLPRQGPGSNKYTREAYAALKNIPQNPRILDLGCGSGFQTIELADISNGQICAVDTHLSFLKKLTGYAKQNDNGKNIHAVNGSMLDIGFKKESFDIIWAEGSIYFIGLEKGLIEFDYFLKPPGYIAATEVSWLKKDPPDEVRKYFEEEYPAIKSIEENLNIIKKSGYSVIDHFTLGEDAWWDNYYTPLEKQIDLYLEEYAGDDNALDMLKSLKIEISMYRKYSDWYGYVFYVMQKKEN